MPRVLSGTRRIADSQRKIAAFALACSFAADALARQTLDLTIPIEMPTLPSPTWAADMIAEVEQEVSALSADEHDPADQPGEQVRRASINIRLIAADLLTTSDRVQPEGNISAVAAMHVLANRTSIDAALTAMLERSDLPPRTSALALLRRFNLAAAARLADGSLTDPAKLDATLQATFAPLSECLASFDGQQTASHWTRAPESTLGGIAELRNDSDLPNLDEIDNLIEQSALPGDARDDLHSVIDYLKRGEQFPELQPLVSKYTRIVLNLIDCALAISSATWLNPVQRETYLDRINNSVRLFKEPSTRQQGVDFINALTISGAVIERITSLSHANVNIKHLAMALERVEKSPVSNHLNILAAIVQRMLEFRELEPAHFVRDMRLIDRQLHSAYLQAEQALIQFLAKTDSESLSLADPSFGSLVADQRQRLGDVQRLRRVIQWNRAVQQIDPPSAARFETQTIRMAKGLLDPNRRPDSIAAMNDFEIQLARFQQLPFELELKSNDAVAIELTGGSHVELLGIVHETRRAWCQDWASGNATGEASRRMRHLHRLMLAMSELAIITHANPDAALLNRWAAWHIDATSLDHPISELASRLKLATASAIAQEDQALAEQLDRIEREAPLARLAGRLTRILGEDLSKLPEGAVGAFGTLSHAPDEHAFMCEQRLELAMLCRLVAEERHALRMNQPQSAEGVRGAVNAIAEQLLHESDSEFAFMDVVNDSD